MNKRKVFPVLVSGMLVEVIEAKDQGYYEKLLIGKVGLVIKNTNAKSSPNVWEVLIEDKIFNLHALVLKEVK